MKKWNQGILLNSNRLFYKVSFIFLLGIGFCYAEPNGSILIDKSSKKETNSTIDSDLAEKLAELWLEDPNLWYINDLDEVAEENRKAKEENRKAKEEYRRVTEENRKAHKENEKQWTWEEINRKNKQVNAILSWQ